MTLPPPTCTLFPYTTLFRSVLIFTLAGRGIMSLDGDRVEVSANRSEEHTSELQSRGQLVCRLLLEKKKATRMLCLCLRARRKYGRGRGTKHNDAFPFDRTFG